ncbi:hypothetical protein LEP1GSC088_3744 [Leptospira interrogans str. L1207]|nr:hypothetical protein LEP1GSC088_3744 [Leptospira interrogans str. L1207]
MKNYFINLKFHNLQIQILILQKFSIQFPNLELVPKPK